MGIFRVGGWIWSEEISRAVPGWQIEGCRAARLGFDIPDTVDGCNLGSQAIGCSAGRQSAGNVAIFGHERADLASGPTHAGRAATANGALIAMHENGLGVQLSEPRAQVFWLCTTQRYRFDFQQPWDVAEISGVYLGLDLPADRARKSRGSAASSAAEAVQDAFTCEGHL